MKNLKLEIDNLVLATMATKLSLKRSVWELALEFIRKQIQDQVWPVRYQVEVP